MQHMTQFMLSKSNLGIMLVDFFNGEDGDVELTST